MANEIIKVNNTTVISCLTVPSATKYHFRISRYYDFSVIDAQNSAPVSPIYTAVLTTGVDKYYYQYRPYISSWQKWAEVNSFHRVTGGADLTITDAKWLMFEASERATYTLQFTSAPQYTWTESQLFRTAERNLAGDLLSEFWTTKAKIKLTFGENNTLSVTEKNQLMRYYSMSSNDIYLACAPATGSTYYRNIWKVYFTEEPAIQPLDGNEERFIVSVVLEER
jgi:hypothetical protein